MAWHLWMTDASGPAATAHALAATGFTPTDETTSLDMVISEADDGDTLAVVPGVGSGLLVVARFYLDDDVAAALSASGGRAVTALWQGVTDSYVLTEHRDGALTRHHARTAGEVVLDDGEPLPQEAGVDWSDAEFALFDLVAAITGVDISRVDAETEVRLLRRARLEPPSRPAPSAPPRKKRGWFRR